MYNGIGLTTPRGSGTNGYVVRNLSFLRNHETAAERAAAYDALAPPKHREPDEAILEHERKRSVEVKCLELQLKLEDDGLGEDEVESTCAALRQRLLKDLEKTTSYNAKKLKESDTHGLAAAKKTENLKMAAALGTRSDYVEGDAFNQEKQAELREIKATQRQQLEEKRRKQQQEMEEQKRRWEAERKEKDRLRRREEDRIRQANRRHHSIERHRLSPPLNIKPGSREREHSQKDARIEESSDRRRRTSPNSSYARRSASHSRTRHIGRRHHSASISPPLSNRIRQHTSLPNSHASGRHHSHSQHTSRQQLDRRSASPPRGRRKERSPVRSRSRSREGSSGSSMSMSPGSSASER